MISRVASITTYMFPGEFSVCFTSGWRDEDRYKQFKVGGRADISAYSKYIYHLVYSLSRNYLQSGQNPHAVWQCFYNFNTRCTTQIYLGHNTHLSNFNEAQDINRNENETKGIEYLMIYFRYLCLVNVLYLMYSFCSILMRFIEDALG